MQTEPVRIRILLFDLSPLLHDIIAGAVRGEPDMELVGDKTDHELGTKVRETRADVVIAALMDGKLSENCEALTWARPPIAVFGLEERSGRAVLYRLRPQAIKLGEVSPRELLSEARAVATEAALPQE